MDATIIVHGDSISAGAYDLEKGGWVCRLRAALMERHLSGNRLYAQVYNFSRDGETTTSVLEHIEQDYLSVQPTHAIIAIGVNDAALLNGKAVVPIENFVDNLRTILQIAKAFTDRILYIPPLFVDENQTRPVEWANLHYINERIEEYGNAAIDVCREEGIAYLDLRDKWKEQGLSAMVVDGVHPNAKGHEFIFRTILEFVEHKWGL